MNPIDPEQPTDQAYLWEAANEEAQARAIVKKDLSNLSPLAQRIYNAIRVSSGYLAVWTIAELLEIEMPANFCGSGEWTETDTAMKELVDGDFIEELPDLHCRYRIKAEDPIQPTEAHTRQGLVILTPSEAARLRRRIEERATALETEIGQALGSVQEAMAEAWALANDPARRRLNDAAPMMLTALQETRDLLKTLLQVAVFLHSDRQAVIKRLARLEAVIGEATGEGNDV